MNPYRINSLIYPTKTLKIRPDLISFPELPKTHNSLSTFHWIYMPYFRALRHCGLKLRPVGFYTFL